MKLMLALVLVGWVSEGLAAPPEDLITNLPGLSWEINFKQYSGYLHVAGTKRLHYWYVYLWHYSVQFYISAHINPHVCLSVSLPVG